MSARPSPEAETVERALHDSETRLQQVLDNTSALVFAKNADGRYIFVNREFERASGRPAAEILGRDDEAIFPPELVARFRHNDLRVLREGRSIQFEEVADFGEGPRTYLASKFPLFDAGGAVYAVCGMATDITDRKRLEEALTVSALAVSQSDDEALYRQLVQYLATILGVEAAFIAVRDPGDPMRLNMQAFYMDGQVRENFAYDQRGTPCETVVGKSFRLYPSNLRQLFPDDLDFQKLRFESYAGHPLIDAGGRGLGLIAVVSRSPLEHAAFVESVLRIFAVRVTAELERDAARQALRTSEANYREIFQASEDAILVHDWDTGAIVDANPRACEAYGYARTELIGLEPRRLGSDEPPAAEDQALRSVEAAKRDGSASFEWRRRRKDGTLHWDEVRLKSVFIGGQRRILAITRDITERREAEQRREQLESRLRQAQKMEAIGQLTGGIAHDFNNLLTTIMGYVTLAGERDTARGDARLGGYLDQARRGCERARDLIQQLLMFSRGQRGSPRVVRLDLLVQESLPALRGHLSPQLDCTVQLDGAPLQVSIDPVQVEQVLVNLVLNARDALEGGAGRIEVGVGRARLDAALCCAGCRATVEGEFVELFVADSGPGIDAQTAERIFEPFFTTKEAGKGTGMGLAIVHGIVHEHGGHVLLESARGRGARFRVLLPAAPAATRTGASTAAGDDQSARPEPIAAGSVLVVDDEETVAQFMRELLESWGLHAEYVTRADAAVALVEADPERFDAVVTDQAMPRMSGLELVRRLNGLRPGLPVVVHTGNVDAMPALGEGAVRPYAVLQKPVDPARLREVLAACLAAGAQRASTPAA
jgi:PAS domain S-box-containing protein